MEKDFRTKSSLNMIISLLKSIWEADIPVKAWNIVGNEQCEVDLQFVVVNGPKREVILSYQDEDLPALTKLLAPKVDMNFFIPEEMILFRSMVTNILPHENRIKIQLPTSMSMTERRVGPRYLVINQDPDIKVSFKLGKRGADGQIFTKNCYDLSAEGLSFLVNNSDSNYFRRGDEVSNVILHYGKESIKISFSVLSIIPIEPSGINGLLYASTKIGVRFSELSLDAKENIEKLVEKLDSQRNKKT